jgi:hypothetical protein
MKFSKIHSSSVLAFPRTAEYGAAVEKPAPNKDHIVVISCFIAAIALITMGVLGMLPGNVL